MSETNLNRRSFVALTVAAGVCACDCAANAEPGDGKGPKRDQPVPPTVDIGTLEDFATDGVYDKFAPPAKVLVIRNAGKLYASSARCTHKGCTLKLKSSTELRCPCHQSTFDINGVPTGGPAKVSLVRYALKVNDEKHIIVNTKQSFAEKDWEKPGASIQIPA